MIRRFLHFHKLSPFDPFSIPEYLYFSLEMLFEESRSILLLVSNLLRQSLCIVITGVWFPSNVVRNTDLSPIFFSHRGQESGTSNFRTLYNNLFFVSNSVTYRSLAPKSSTISCIAACTAFSRSSPGASLNSNFRRSKSIFSRFLSIASQ